MNRLPSQSRGSRSATTFTRSRGFSLIELMIVVTVIALLATIAYPAYQDSIWKGKRGEAKTAIMRALQAEERYYTQANSYVAYTTSTTEATLSSQFPRYSADNLGNSRYTMSAAATGNGLCNGVNDPVKCIVVTATVIGTADPKCGASLSADSMGNRFPAVTAASPADQCWK